jgi:hypothetical protein
MSQFTIDDFRVGMEQIITEADSDVFQKQRTIKISPTGLSRDLSNGIRECSSVTMP